MLSSDQDRVIEREVQGMLERSPSFHALSIEDRRGIYDSTARIARQLVEQQLTAPPRGGRRDPYATGQDAPPFPGPPLPGAPLPPGMTAPAPTPQTDDKWRVDERFRAEGIAAGVTQAGRILREVDFPGFVSSLVKGVFNAVVDASIQQMKAYGELVNSVAMSIGDFADQHVDPGEGQKHLAKKYPNIFEMASGKLQVKEDYDDGEGMPDFQAELGLDAPVEDLGDEDSLQKLIAASRTEIARGRQQLLATTILMGINRIIVTDGRINAKLKFDFVATDTITRAGMAADYDTQKQVMEGEVSMAEGYVKGRFEKPVSVLVSSTQGTSAATLNAEAHLTGEVQLKFRSETFPLEKMMNSDQLFKLNQAQSGGRGVPAAPAPPAATPPAPPAAQPPATPPQPPAR
jgi:hypothetical protein